MVDDDDEAELDDDPYEAELDDDDPETDPEALDLQEGWR